MFHVSFHFFKNKSSSHKKTAQNKHWLWCKDTFGFKHAQCNEKFSYIIIMSGHFDMPHINSYSLWVDLQIGLKWNQYNYSMFLEHGPSLMA
jgi:hypothetical protein